MAAQLLDRLVIVVPHHAVLRMESGQLRAVVEQRLVRDQYPERLSEEVRLQEHRPRLHAGLAVHSEEPEPFPVVETHHHAVRLAAFPWMPPPLGTVSPVLFLVLVHITMDLVVSRHKRSFGNRTAGGNRLPDFGEEALPVRGQGRFGSNPKPFGVTQRTPCCVFEDTKIRGKRIGDRPAITHL